MAVVNMKDTDYYKSGEHTKNALAACEVATLAAKEATQKRKDDYNINPKVCLEESCDNILDYKHKNNKFCSRSCSGKHNNAKRRNAGHKRSEASRDKTSKSLKGKKKLKKSTFKRKKHSPIIFYCKAFAY